MGESSHGDGDVVRVDDATIRRIARCDGPRQSLPAIVVRQAWTEWRLKIMRGIHFRHRDNRSACAAYEAMTPQDFAGINARQAWANWRTIPRNLTGRLPSRAVRMVDLCCGIGESTAVLARYAAPGSDIIGLEWNGTLVDAARSRSFHDADGGRAQVAFHRQSVLDPFCDGDGVRLPDGSCDLVNASGAVANHFDAGATAVLFVEIVRVLRPGGVALIDAGAAGTDAAAVRAIARRHGLECVHAASSCLFDRSRQLCFVRAADPPGSAG